MSSRNVKGESVSPLLFDGVVRPNYEVTTIDFILFSLYDVTLLVGVGKHSQIGVSKVFSYIFKQEAVAIRFSY